MRELRYPEGMMFEFVDFCDAHVGFMVFLVCVILLIRR